MTDANQFDPRDLDRALEGLEFPASRDAILRTAADKGGINGNVLVVLERIPDQSYDSRDQLEAAVAEAYIEESGLTQGMPVVEPEPAAPGDPSVKRYVATAADTRRGEPYESR